MSDSFVVYDKETLSIISIAGGNHLSDVTPEQFLKEKHKTIAPKKTIEELGVIMCPEKLFNTIAESGGRFVMVIDPRKNQVTCELVKEEQRNTTYNDREVKRDFSLNDVHKMYNDDYINFNLKNFIKSNNLNCGFIPLSDIRIRSHMFNKNWNYFHSDPYLTDSNFDKLKLGRDVVNNGTYWPLIVAPQFNDKPDQMYVFEGNHRVMSLKLLQMEGEIPDDFKVFCIRYNQNYEMLQCEGRYKEFINSFKMRAIIELVYGDEVITNNVVLQKVIQELKNNGDSLVDEYTIETTGYNYDDGFIALQSYAHFLRDLIYNHKDSISPSIYLNDPIAYEEWINDV